MKFGDILHGTITRFDNKGRGVFDEPKGGGGMRPVLIPFTTIGDVVEASFVKRQEGCSVSNLVRIISPGPSRRTTPLSPSCPQNPGMLWADINYADQVIFKRAMIDEALKQAGHREAVDEIIPCPADRGTAFGVQGSDESLAPSSSTAPRTPYPVPLYYRNRMDYAFGWKGELGMKEYGSWNRYVDLTDCLLLNPQAPEILNVFRTFMTRHPELKPWDAKRQEGDLRYVIIREGKQPKERLIALIVKDLNHFSDDIRKELVTLLDRFANNIVLAENPAITDLSFGHTIVPLKGKETFDEIVNGTRYTIQLNSFFQTNPLMAGKLQDVVANIVRDRCEKRDARSENTSRLPTSVAFNAIDFRLLDLYCGLGFFAINMAQRFSDIHVSGFELYEPMIELAKFNAKKNGVEDRCAFTGGKAEELSWKDIDADIVIVDPPRAGLHHKVITTLLEKAPETIIYISCDYHHLVKELVQFKEKYEIKKITALDLFPHTPHVEVVTELVKRKD
jgi:tRNA/tmRNA/rRNA uracil-C5-methylase (TrmA/RlmC/RlmD family)